MPGKSVLNDQKVLCNSSNSTAANHGIDIEKALAEARRVLSDDYKPNLDVLELYGAVNNKPSALRSDGFDYHSAVSAQAIEKYVASIIDIKVQEWLRENMPAIVKDLLVNKIDKLQNE